jgi:S1-C subfamily serine protease
MRRAVGLAERDGVLVREVEPDSAAARAGVREGDMIVEAAGRPMLEPDDLYDALGTLAGAPSIKLRLVRGADEMELEATFVEA